MVGVSLATASRRWSVRTRVLVLIGLLLLAVVGSMAANGLLEARGRTAPWAPSVGILAALALVAPKRWRIGVTVSGSVAIGLGAVAAGRELEFSTIVALVRVFEVLVLCALVDRARGALRFDSLRSTVQFIGAALVSAAIFAVGVSVYRLVDGERGWDAIATDSFTAQLASLLLITPLAFLHRRQGGRARPAELALQAILMALVTGAVFSPFTQLPLAFVVLPFFAWAALRLSSFVVASELIVVAVLTSAATLVGWGPFGQAVDASRDSVALLQVFLSIFAGSTLVLWAKRVEGEIAADRAVAQDRILRRAVEQAQTAFLLVERIGDSFIVLQANDHGLRALGMDPSNEFFATSSDINIALPPDHPLIPGLAAVAAGAPGWRGELVLDAFAGRADADVAMERGADDGEDIIAVELTDITERRREDRRLRALVERERALSAQYQELSRQKDDFVASISHELRTPLASIVGYAETLEETTLDGQQRRFVDTIVRNAGRLQERVEELLSAAKRAADSVDDPHPLVIDGIIADVADDLRAVASAREVEIVVESSAVSLPEVIGTEDSVTRVLTNIVSNAVKFSPDASSVVVSALIGDEEVEIFVRDSGPGIPLADQDRVFDRFYRTEDATANATPGTGLGLSIVRTLLDGIGGSVLVESDGASGSTFVVRFARAHDLDPVA